MGFRWGFIANCYLNAVNVMYCDVSLWLLTYLVNASNHLKELSAPKKGVKKMLKKMYFFGQIILIMEKIQQHPLKK